MQRAGVLDVPALTKLAGFAKLCDTFNIPLAFLQDVPGLMIGKDAERGGILAGYKNVVTTLAYARVPKVAIVVRKAYGGGHIALGGRPVRPDLLFAWPTAEMGFMAPDTGVRTVYRRQLDSVLAEEGKDAHDALVAELEAEWAAESEPWEAAANIILDDVIEPEDTRAVIADGHRVRVADRPARDAHRHVDVTGTAGVGGGRLRGGPAVRAAGRTHADATTPTTWPRRQPRSPFRASLGTGDRSSCSGLQPRLDVDHRLLILGGLVLRGGLDPQHRAEHLAGDRDERDPRDQLDDLVLAELLAQDVEHRVVDARRVSRHELGERHREAGRGVHDVGPRLPERLAVLAADPTGRRPTHGLLELQRQQALEADRRVQAGERLQDVGPAPHHARQQAVGDGIAVRI